MASRSIAISDLAFTWPDGTTQFTGIDAVFGPGHTGVVGLNGSGKSTLLRLIAGDLAPDRGSITVGGRIGYLRQSIALDTGRHADEILGIDGIRKALHRIESGTGSADDFDVVAGRWDVEERAVALIGSLGLGHIVSEPAQLDRPVSTLSGGEAVLLGFVAELLQDPDVLLLDEPTNNLDRYARQRLYEAVDAFGGSVLTVSHDRDLLDRADDIAELRAGSMRLFGGNFTTYQQIVEREQETARAAIRDARGDVRKQNRELVEARIKLDRRLRTAKKAQEEKRVPKILSGLRKMAAEESAGKLRNNHIEKAADAAATLAQAETQLRDDREIRLDLPATRLFPGQDVIELTDLRLACGPVVSLAVSGPERIGLIGRNGIGKTTLLRAIVDAGPRVPWRWLPQRLDIFDGDRSIADNVASVAPQALPEQIRAQLARFLFRGSDADKPAVALSGGEQLRAALAMLLLAQPAPQLLLLDEPTNNLDLPSLAHLTQALSNYRGALIVASHDIAFLRQIGITRWVELNENGLVPADDMASGHPEASGHPLH
ncbi:ABC-F family ATP-binding cassette domain-containing protein [Antrihabitans sp. YC3-6]|uniref:ABC-F family ATP-binding cassette domain-containing protein n=1 Tax=Antrihabitans stalagmiti TaxID=2799499 RepID=A0A934U6H5_9NOCA|nr:ATP-binding cassette domain-containing protein [Antrihabitans stalagmiti]MBJ8342585.1 ABC-F family ATP-binding cassette domain-containing protein [Antrihabitans stalagmiti]